MHFHNSACAAVVPSLINVRSELFDSNTTSNFHFQRSIFGNISANAGVRSCKQTFNVNKILTKELPQFRLCSSRAIFDQCTLRAV